MNFKILILDNKIPFALQNDLNEVNQFSSSKFGITFTVQNIDHDVSLIPLQTVQGYDRNNGKAELITKYILDPIALQTYVKTLVKQGQYHLVMYGWNMANVGDNMPSNTGINSYTSPLPMYPGTMFVQWACTAYNEGVVPNGTENWKNLIHEIYHSIVWLGKSLGFTINDFMDSDSQQRSYYKNSDPTAIDGNFSQTYAQFKPYLTQIINSLNPIKMEATLVRQSDDGKETKGTLTFGNQTACTLERPWLNNQANISCIPKGDYQMIWSHMIHLNEDHYQVMNVPNRTSIFLHEMNYVSQVEGCIGVGTSFADLNNDKELDLSLSRLALGRLETWGGHQNITLHIV